MKRSFYLIIATLVLMLFFTSCKSRAEKELEQAQKHVEAMEQLAEEAQKDLEAIESDIDEYENAVEALEEDQNNGTANVEFDVQEVDAALQGTWVYYDSAIGMTDELVFTNGSLLNQNHLEAAPGQVFVSAANYTVENGYIDIYFSAKDFHSIFEYSWIGNELIIYKNISEGYDKGNTRIYQKQDAEISHSDSSVTADKESDFVLPVSTTEAPDSEVLPTTSKPSVSERVTSGMKNALKSAENYLAFMPFSYTGLIEQAFPD